MNKKNDTTKDNLVLVAVDESEAAPLIVDFLTDHKWSSGTRFRIIHVVAPILMDHPMASYPLFLESVEKDVREYAEKLLIRVKSDMQAHLAQFEIETEVLSGIPAEVIVDEAKRLHAAMIVVGSHGRTGFTRFFLGSVSGAVVSHAPCNVMIVRVPKKPIAKAGEKVEAVAGRTSQEKCK
ncbi:MAG: universal stress protein [Candidatus Melainabacteria bacterium]|jgi:nucleotide-binding universal stress UspA family protein|nr:universal stress protein [Candidatus Melainabacteria bacterium]